MKKKVKIDIKNKHILSKIANLISYLVFKPIYIYIYGPVGIGKSYFCKKLINSFGYKGFVNSPSYSLVNKYKCRLYFLYHFDFYRINCCNQLFNYFDIEDYFDRTNICLVEWPKCEDIFLPLPDLKIFFIYDKNFNRSINIEYFSGIGKNILQNKYFRYEV